MPPTGDVPPDRGCLLSPRCARCWLGQCVYEMSSKRRVAMFAAYDSLLSLASGAADHIEHCHYCGNALPDPRTHREYGRLYCNHSCKMRAYEVRARARAGESKRQRRAHRASEPEGHPAPERREIRG